MQTRTDVNTELLAAPENLLAHANRYSDEMAKIGRGSEQLGTLADSVSAAGMARAAIARAKQQQRGMPFLGEVA